MANYCKYCGSPLSDDTIYCENCGKAVGANGVDSAHGSQGALDTPWVDSGQPWQGAYDPSAVTQQAQTYDAQQQTYSAPPQPYAAQQPYDAQPYDPSAITQQAQTYDAQQTYSAPPQPYAATPAPLDYRQRREMPPYSRQPSAQPQKKGGGLLAYRIIMSILAVALIAFGVYGAATRRGGGKPGSSDSDKDKTPGSSLGNTPGKTPGDDGPGSTEAADALRSYLDALWASEGAELFDVATLARDHIDSAVLAPTGGDATLDFDELTVTFPAGFSDEPLNVTLSEIIDMPPLDDFLFEKVYDLRVEGMDKLPGIIAVTLPYKPYAIESLYDLYLMVWDEMMGWVPRPYTVDEEACTVTMYTDHLCPVSLQYIETAWAILGELDDYYGKVKIARDVVDFVSSREPKLTASGNFRIFYNEYSLWYALDRNDYMKQLKEFQEMEKKVPPMNEIEYKTHIDPAGNMRRNEFQKQYNDYLKSFRDIYKFEVPDSMKEIINGAIKNLGDLLESYYSAYENAGYEMGGSFFAYPVMIGGGGASFRTDIIASLAHIYLTNEELLMYVAHAAENEGNSVTKAGVENRIRAGVFQAMLGNVYLADNYSKTASLFFDQVTPFSWLGEDMFWLDGLYAYVPYSLFVSENTEGFTQIINDRFFTKPITGLNKYEVPLVPYFVQKKLGKPLPVIVADVATDFGGSTTEQIAAACGLDAVSWYKQFVSFVYHDTTYRKGSNTYYSFPDRHTVGANTGSMFYLEFVDGETYGGDAVMFGYEGAGVDDGIILIEGEGGYVDIALLQTVGSLSSWWSGTGTARLMAYETGEEVLTIDFPLKGQFSAEFYRLEFNIFEYSISPDEIDITDEIGHGGYLTSAEFYVTSHAKQTTFIDVMAWVDGVVVLDLKEEQFAAGEKRTFRYELPEDLHDMKVPPKWLEVELYDYRNKDLIKASESISLICEQKTVYFDLISTEYDQQIVTIGSARTVDVSDGKVTLTDQWSSGSATWSGMPSTIEVGEQYRVSASADKKISLFRIESSGSIYGTISGGGSDNIPISISDYYVDRGETVSFTVFVGNNDMNGTVTYTYAQRQK